LGSTTATIFRASSTRQWEFRPELIGK